MHDTTFFEERGLPTTFVATVEFEDGAEIQARALGFEPFGVFVEHPIQDRTDDEMLAIATRSCSAVTEALVTS